MFKHVVELDQKFTKSYASKKALIKRVEELLAPYKSEYADKAFIVKTEDDRWTAIFSIDVSKGGYIGRYSQHGFYTC